MYSVNELFAHNVLLCFELNPVICVDSYSCQHHVWALCDTDIFVTVVSDIHIINISLSHRWVAVKDERLKVYSETSISAIYYWG